MKFLRLPDPLLSVLYEDDDILAIDKPYGFNTHTNDSKIAHSDFIQDGLIEIFEKQRNCKLHIIHRLDQTTTGVVIFGKSQESAKKYAQYFFDRKVKKTYLFITAKKSRQTQFLIEQAIIHKGRELEAKTHLKFLKKNQSFELWQANPLTGRNHQIRIHSQAAHIPILGDAKCGGQSFPFLCLHNHRIEFPNSLVITAKPPAYFDSLDLLNDRFASQLLFEIDRRQRLFAQQSMENIALRLVDIKDRCSIDQFGPHLVLNPSKQTKPDINPKHFALLSSLLQKQVLSREPKPQNPSQDKTSWVTEDNGLKFEVILDTNPFTGLATNQRLHRHWVQKNSKDKTVLNLFASTCSYGLAAAQGGAVHVSMVEKNKNYLSWGKRNFELNRLRLEQFQFLCRDSMTYIKQCSNKKQKFDLVLCEIPSFYRRESGTFQIQNDLHTFLIDVFNCLNEKGSLMIATTYEKFFVDDLRQHMLKALNTIQMTPQTTHSAMTQTPRHAPDKKIIEINCILPSLDFELPDQKAHLKSFLIQFL